MAAIDAIKIDLTRPDLVFIVISPPCFSAERSVGRLCLPLSFRRSVE
jgi:hypothetical protein